MWDFGYPGILDLRLMNLLLTIKAVHLHPLDGTLQLVISQPSTYYDILCMFYK